MRSMTGFASLEGGASDDAAAPRRWRWEGRSVNGRGLDVRFRTPAGWDGREPVWRAQAAKVFARGSIQFSLNLSVAAEEEARLTLRPGALAQAAAAAAAARAEIEAHGAPAAAVDPVALLGLRGVLEWDGAAPADGPSAEETAAVDAGFADLCAALDAARAQEGAALEAALAERFDALEALLAGALDRVAPRKEAARRRLAERVAELMDAGAPLDEARLAQELATLAVKNDIQEELDRLRAHIDAARALTAAAGAIGRKLDFMTQEFNREANTLCSKAQDAALTEIGLEMKVVIDQLREQAANVE